MARFSLATGLRRSNVTHSEWSQVDLQRSCAWIHPDQAKARKAIAVPLSTSAKAVLEEQLGKNPRYVFPYKGRPVIQTSTKAWKKALERVGIENFRLHDLRHTWASWHIQAGTPVYILKELGGWESMEMAKRHAHLSVEHTASFAEKLTIPNGTDLGGTNLEVAQI